MKFVRAIDELGRIVLPFEAREQFHWGEGDKIDIYVDSENQSITLIKSEAACLCCHSNENLRQLSNGQFLCSDCIQKMK